MTFIERNKDGAIVGVYANPQPGYAEEESAEESREVAEFRASFLVPAFDVKKRLQALEAAVIAKNVITKADVDAKVELVAEVAEVSVKS